LFVGEEFDEEAAMGSRAAGFLRFSNRKIRMIVTARTPTNSSVNSANPSIVIL
jgi:hypothetical protein